jgi:hypothetical protein
MTAHGACGDLLRMAGSCGYRRLIEDPLDGASATATLHATPKAAVDEARIQRPRSNNRRGIAYLVVG